MGENEISMGFPPFILEIYLTVGINCVKLMLVFIFWWKTNYFLKSLHPNIYLLATTVQAITISQAWKLRERRSYDHKANKKNGSFTLQIFGIQTKNGTSADKHLQLLQLTCIIMQISVSNLRTGFQFYSERFLTLIRVSKKSLFPYHLILRGP